MLLILFWMISVTNGNNNEMIQSFPSSPGIYYEKIGILNFYETNWNIVSYVNISELEDKNLKIGNLLKTTSEICKHEMYSVFSNCNVSINIMKSLREKLIEKEGSLKNLVGKSRNKR